MTESDGTVQLPGSRTPVSSAASVGTAPLTAPLKDPLGHVDPPHGDWGFTRDATTLGYGPQFPHFLTVDVLKLLLPRLGHQCRIEELVPEVISERLVIVDPHLQHMSTGAREVIATYRRWDILTLLAFFKHANETVLA